MSENVKDVVEVEGTGGVMPPLKWEEGLFEQVVRGQQFAREWDARSLAKGQTAADASPCYITLFADFVGDGNFRLLATDFFCGILAFCHFHIQLSWLGMVQIWHFEFCCRSQGVEPTMDRFRTFYQLQINLGFFFVRHAWLEKASHQPSQELP
ncbi:hypothetical protein HanHA300_Chr09g0305781 [Helianthus annuus]|nr:hypothetical protein HanHA300_Chr09g0305781 [Helianthus annuus]KAJ0710392.1 hypothetical protein HanOQP8_Chr09g0311841 [Helianthus annuus]